MRKRRRQRKRKWHDIKAKNERRWSSRRKGKKVKRMKRNDEDLCSTRK